ncbi:DUF3467 domain-containing protein [Mucisphaera calidilacus]|uniref:DUF3467 domain-containing protein n=1 Tax=Mucisphaera calidilacus TaxID=2527982 RepID=A0A518C171_9BACT|nr:DUF3467 domain-containing protein [Mucisphaera calidilacus]QDU72944.1 hypothetical protein Pan265_28200 [Mucisphaera calidilacus]
MAETPEQNETVAAPEQGQQQMQLRIDESDTPFYYASTARVSGTAEEIVVDISRGIQPSGQGQATMKIDARVIMSPWSAKRLAMALGQAVTRYEQAYGTIEIDPRKRQQGGGNNG